MCHIVVYIQITAVWWAQECQLFDEVMSHVRIENSQNYMIVILNELSADDTLLAAVTECEGDYCTFNSVQLLC